MKLSTLGGTLAVFVGSLVMMPPPASAQPASTETPSKKPKETPFTEAIDGYKKIEGLFTFYWNEKESKLLIEIKPEQFGTTFLCNVTRQSGDAQLFDGSSQIGEFPFMFQRVGNKVMLINKNVSFRSDSNEVTARTIGRNLSNSLVGSSKITAAANPTGGGIIVDADPFFMQDVALVGAATEQSKMNFTLDKENSYFAETKSFPLNSEIEINLHFKSSKPQPISTLPDSRSMMHRYHYSIAALPQEPNFKPRPADDRVGHFTTIFQDYSDLMLESPYVRYINRWHLEKENPTAKLSKPKQPLVYWIENTVPVEYREWVKEGVLMWNSAFEKIGFQDAIEVRQMPDTADWDPADARYNTIRWMIQPGGGYAVGPSRAHPYTGQLYDADIRISADFMRYMHDKFHDFIQPLTSHSNPSDPESDEYNHRDMKNMCKYAEGAAAQLNFGLNMLAVRGENLTPELKKKYVHEYLVSLVAHEVGHTLGLRHNFKASSIYSLDQLHDANFTRTHGTSGSVMDYHAVNLAPKGKPQGDFYHLVLGEYDDWAIEYAYKQYDATEYPTETAMLEAIAGKSSKPELTYGTDEDCFGNSSRSIDPTATLFDLSSTPLDYFSERMEMAQELWRNIPKNFDKKGNRYQQYRNAFSQGIGEYFQAARGIPRYVGGIYTNRSHIGDAGGKQPYTVVPAADQRKALQLLTTKIFAADAFNFPPDLLNRLAVERMDDFTGSVWRQTRLDYPVHSIVGAIQTTPLASLYNVNVLTRLEDNEVRFGAGEQSFTMAEMFQTVRDAVWSEVAKGENINSYRRELQRDHLAVLSQLLLKPAAGTPNDAISLARADASLLKKQIDAAVKSKKADAYTKAHLEEVSAKIDATLKAQLQTGS